jgi:hypothetical protein
VPFCYIIRFTFGILGFRVRGMGCIVSLTLDTRWTHVRHTLDTRYTNVGLQCILPSLLSPGVLRFVACDVWRCYPTYAHTCYPTYAHTCYPTYAHVCFPPYACTWMLHAHAHSRYEHTSSTWVLRGAAGMPALPATLLYSLPSSRGICSSARRRCVVNVLLMCC